jgi:hypothetical protein
MLSINGPYSLPPLSELLSSLSSHQVPLVTLRFKLDAMPYGILSGFEPALLEMIFQKFPDLEELCLDQSIDLRWPMPWVSV